MRKLSVFNNISLDGYFVDGRGDMRFAQNQSADPEWDAFVAGNASGGGGLMLFGRVTYEMMVSFWPTPAAMESMPVVAKTMNNASKVVFSRTMSSAAWNNTRLVKRGLEEEVLKLKKEGDQDMIIFGSGTIVTQLAQAGLIDMYQFIVVPLALGSGRTMFAGIKEPLPLKLVRTRAFANGNVLMEYEKG